MATKTVTASLVIDFTQDAGDGVLSLEVDSRDTGYNAGDTSFIPGSEPVFLMFMSSNVVIDRIACSEGALSIITNNEVISVEEYLTYANEKAASPQHPVATGTASITDSAGVVGTPTIAETSVSFAAPQIGVLELTYQSIAVAYKLVGTSGLRPVVIYVAGHTV